MKRNKTLLAAMLMAVTLGAAAHGTQPHKEGPVRKEQTAWGIAGDASAARRTIEVTMTDDMRFTPNHLAVRQGETVQIVVRNAGAMLHEFVMGDKKTLEQHAALMVKFPGMEHDEPYMAHVKPGGTEGLVWTFNRPGQFDFACLVAGHYQAGMVGTIGVAPRARRGENLDNVHRPMRRRRPARAPRRRAGPPAIEDQPGNTPMRNAMNTVRTLLSAALLACVASLAVHAQSPAPATIDASASAALTRGEVRKVDQENRKITLKHEAITPLDMPPMTMVFQVRDPALLDKVHAGDKVLFAAALDGGKLTVTRIELAK